MLCLDEWIELHSVKCTHEDVDPNVCTIALSRSIIAKMIINILDRTKKGALYKHRDNYLMSFGLQLISKYYTVLPVKTHHQVHAAMVDCTLTLITTISEEEIEDPNRVAVHTEVGVKLLACIARFDQAIENDVLFERIPSHVLNLITARAQLIRSDSSVDEEDTGGYEILNLDIAILICRIPRILPLIWSTEKRLQIQIVMSQFLMRHEGSSRFVCEGILMASKILKKVTVSHFLIPRAGEWLQLMIELATSFGSEEDFSLTERQAVYTGVHGFLTTSQTNAMEICMEIISRSRSDACIGIFVKIAKDLWKDTADVFYKCCHLVLTDMHDIMNACDAMKSILNWCRLFYLSPDTRSLRDPREDEWLRDTLGTLSRGIDSALAKSESNEMAKTRIIFLGHLLARVRDIM